MNIELIKSMVEQGFIHEKKHEEYNLFIYNYTPKAQYDRVWNEATLNCRGLILDGQGKIIARPFQKFFNLGEYEGQRIPSESFEVYDKMDGSLGITYCIEGRWFIATRGSFISDQSKKANDLLQTKYSHVVPKFEEGKTYLMEIIYPDNRIVLDYGTDEELVLLAIIDNRSGKDLPLIDIGLPIVKKYDGLNDLEAIRKIQIDNKEGFIIKYEDGYRLKIKFEEYVRLHRIITQVSTLSIWEYLKTGQSMDEIIENVPDEFYDWVKEVKNDLEKHFKAIENQCKEVYKELDTRKETAMYFMQCQHPSVLFSMLDKRPYDEIIWKLLKPAHAKPFINEQ